LRLRPGQYVSPGEAVVSVGGDHLDVTLVALLPGGYRPLLARGTRMRVELDGFKHEYKDFTVDSVGDQIVGPNEVRRFLGADIGDAVVLNGPLVVVKAHVATPTFQSKGRSFNYYDGMLARADARVRTERIFVTLVPGLKGVLSP